MKKWVRKILKGISLTAALFVFQACYGSPQIPENQDKEIAEEIAEETVPEQGELPA